MKAGDRFDKYSIVRVLGEGGMATVYLARHVVLNSTHALKILRVDHEAVRRRLIEEGRAQATLRHAHVVEVTDILDTDNGVGLVMEYVNGPTLAEHQRGRALSVGESLGLFKGMLLGIRAAHQANLVHRDLKPENILLHRTEEGLQAKVTDFGLVKVLEGSGTKAGVMMGTPEYMAPEQARNAAGVDARADLWSLGAIFYEMLTGKVAFQRDDLVETYAAIVSGRYPPLPTTVPENVRRVVDRLLQVNVADRYADVEAVLVELYPDDSRPPMATLTHEVLGLDDDDDLLPPTHLTPTVGYDDELPSEEVAAVLAEPDVDDEPTYVPERAAPVPSTPLPAAPAAQLPRAPLRPRAATLVGLLVGGLVVAVLAGIALAWWWLPGDETPADRDVVLELTGAEGQPVALWVDGKPFEVTQAVRGVPGEAVAVRWAVGEACSSCPAPCPVWCAQGHVEVPVAAGEGVQVVQLPVSPPPPRPVVVDDPALSTVRVVEGPALTVDERGARGELVPGRWVVVAQRGACADAPPDCAVGDRCPPGCVSVTQPVEVPLGDTPFALSLSVPPLPAPAARPSPAPAAPRPSAAPTTSWVSREAFAAFVGSHPEWARDAAVASGRADAGYLREGLEGAGPVTRVTWSAANAYCAGRGGLLPVDAEPTTWDATSVTQEWRQAGGRVAWRRFDGVSSTKARADQAFPFTGFRCAR